MARLGVAAAAALLLAAGIAPVAAGPVTYNYNMVVTSTNAGITDGTLSFTLSAAPTSAQNSINISSEITAFDVRIDGQVFSAFTDCGAHPTGCVSDLQFQSGNLRDLTYFGLSDASTPDFQVSLQTSATNFSWFNIRTLTANYYAGGNFAFANNDPPDPPAAKVPEPASMMLLLAGLGGLTMLLRGRRAA